ncbi:MAG: hypothetical protein FWC16_14875 [Defluviitaleaceae bacterium]|nr:hypothetical protein [Defluviitaleaceae bacterium]MCL2276199.1 hypothetical protein [Defluviitaleaceae bacterium]
MEAKLDTKIALYNAENERIGETFSRRARQLVKQQRAQWTDETHTAIRFLPDAPEEWEMSEMVSPSPEVDAAPEAHDSNSTLYVLARTRIGTRRRMLWHTLALLPGILFISLIADGMFRGFDAGFVLGVGLTLWGVSYFKTVRNFLKYNRGFFMFADMEGRHARKLAAEIEALKRMGYRG